MSENSSKSNPNPDIAVQSGSDSEDSYDEELMASQEILFTTETYENEDVDAFLYEAMRARLGAGDGTVSNTIAESSNMVIPSSAISTPVPTNAPDESPHIPQLNAILAIDKEYGIGKNDTIPWRIPNDMKFFYKTTVNNVVIMGRKTYFSIAETYRPLKDRINIVLTRNPELPEYKEVEAKHPNVRFVSTIDFNELDQISKAEFPFLKERWDYFVIGGAFIYELFTGKYDNIYLTRVDGIYDCDTRISIIMFLFQFQYRRILEVGEGYHIELLTDPWHKWRETIEL